MSKKPKTTTTRPSTRPTAGAGSAGATVHLPMADPLHRVYKTRHLDAQLEQPEAEVLARIRAGLVAQHATLSNGRPVFAASDVLRWILQKAGEGNGQAAPEESSDA